MANYDFKSNKEEYLSGKNLIELNQKLDINYPPFHYFIENITLGSLINIISKLTLNNQSILKLIANKFNMYDSNVFLNYLLRLKEIRNRCAHNSRLFNRNFRWWWKYKKLYDKYYEDKISVLAGTYRKCWKYSKITLKTSKEYLWSEIKYQNIIYR